MTTYETIGEMPEDYRKVILQMMESQAYRELAAAHMFGDGLKFVPSLKWLKFMTWHIREEMEHYEDVVKMYERCTAGQDVPNIEDTVAARLAAKPFAFATTWLELAMAQYLYDRGGFWQLQEYEDCTFLPYREVIHKIVKEEAGHQELGERIVIELCQDEATRAEAQPLFEKWLRIGLLSFGRPGTDGNRFAIENGIKARDSGECMKDFVDDIRKGVAEAGLAWPTKEALGLEMPDDLVLA